MLRPCFFLLINLNEALVDLKNSSSCVAIHFPQSGCDIAVAGPKGMGINTLSLWPFIYCRALMGTAVWQNQGQNCLGIAKHDWAVVCTCYVTHCTSLLLRQLRLTHLTG